MFQGVRQNHTPVEAELLRNDAEGLTRALQKARNSRKGTLHGQVFIPGLRCWERTELGPRNMVKNQRGFDSALEIPQAFHLEQTLGQG